MLLYSLHEEENALHTQGFALILTNKAPIAIMGWKSYRFRMIKASSTTKKENVIQCCEPTNDHNDDDNDQVYERLRSVIAKCSRNDLTILITDLDTKVEMDNIGYEDISGQHRLTGRGQRKW